MPKVEIVNTETGEVAHTIETHHEPGTKQYELFLDGLYRKVDFERFYVREETP